MIEEFTSTELEELKLDVSSLHSDLTLIQVTKPLSLVKFFVKKPGAAICVKHHSSRLWNDVIGVSLAS